MTEAAAAMLREIRRTDTIRLVYVTGARTATLSNRLPFLPAADAYVCENGGRIFYPRDPSDVDARPTLEDLVEDDGWRRVHDPAVGPSSNQAQAPESRTGPLWALYCRLVAEGWSIDTNSYYTGFRVRLTKPQEEIEALKQAIQAGQVPEDPQQLLTCTFNLALLDVYPKTSGKAQAARYLMDKFASPADTCCHMGDDDNDLELAALVRRMFVSKPTSASVQRAVAEDPAHFDVVNPGTGQPGEYPEGPMATEEMIRRARAYMQGL